MIRPDFCDSCAKPSIGCPGCKAWRDHYCARQDLINGYARTVYEMSMVDVDALRLYHPERYNDYLLTGPCYGCPAKEHCDIPCAAYLQWWDERMGWFRRKIYGQGKGRKEKADP